LLLLLQLTEKATACLLTAKQGCRRLRLASGRCEGTGGGGGIKDKLRV
jgi:hypothetical protein